MPGRFMEQDLAEVRERANLVEVISAHTQLKKAGPRTFKGLCPFHQEKTPSFGVSPDRGTFKCFGCGEGGDAIAFVEKQENLDFVGAIEWLADRFALREFERIGLGVGARGAPQGAG